VCTITNKTDTKSYHSTNPNLNPTTKQHAVVSIEPNIVICPTYSEKFIRDNAIAPLSLLSVVVVALPTVRVDLRRFNLLL